MRFNVFQRIMRLWDEVHPYNAAQVLQLRGVGDAERAESAWGQTLSILGLGHVQIDGDRFRHESRNACLEPGALRVVEPGVSLEDFVSSEMNRPFTPDESGTFCPFRPFLLQGDGVYFLGVIYHHWVADSVSIRMVLREWFMRLYDPARARNAPLRIPQGGYWHFFGPGRGRWGLDDGLLATLRFATRFGHVRRFEDDGDDFSVRCSYHSLPDGLIDELRTVSRHEGVTLNDIFLAAAAEACDQHGVPHRTGPRQELALGTIVDLRPSCTYELDDVFGLFLGFTTVMVRPQALRYWPQLLKTIAHQTAWQKRGNMAQASVVRMAAAVAEAQWLSPRDWVKFYMSHMPLAAGISNVSLTRTWASEYHPSVLLDYLRFSPTGPTLPLVFTPTSLGGKFHLALTRRTALIDGAGADAIAGVFIRRLESIAGPQRSRFMMAKAS